MRSSVDLPQPEGPDEHDELAVGDVEADAVDDFRACRTISRCSANDTDAMRLTPSRAQLFTAPAVSPPTM